MTYKEQEKLLATVLERLKNHGELKDKWSLGERHHPLSELLIRVVSSVGWEGFKFDLRVGGDGDEGETIMYILDAYFEDLDGISDVKKLLLEESK